MCLERHGLASVRDQVCGSREIIVTDFHTAKAYLDLFGVTAPDDCDLSEWVSQSLQEINTPEQLDTFGKCGRMRRTIVAAHETLVVPMASFVVERVLGDSTVFGHRTSFIDDCQAAIAAFHEMAECHASKVGPEDPVQKFWTLVSGLHKKAS